MREFAFQLNIINLASLLSNICNSYIVIAIVQLYYFVMIQWMWRKLMLFILFLCANGVPTTCVYAHA